VIDDVDAIARAFQCPQPAPGQAGDAVREDECTRIIAGGLSRKNAC
jgi:hypothetical protein